MRVETSRTITLTLTLTEKEAIWLRDHLQYIPDGWEDSEIRRMLLEELRMAL
jgi:hypothetical protein